MVKFFRISETGSLKRPTLFALGAFAALSASSVAIFFDYPFVVIFAMWPAEYVLCALLFSKPFRITLSRYLHWTRYPHISSSPTESDVEWQKSNEELFNKTGVRLFKGSDDEERILNRPDVK
mgnify:CR=1 FL=1